MNLIRDMEILLTGRDLQEFMENQEITAGTASVCIEAFTRWFCDRNLINGTGVERRSALMRIVI